MPIDDRQLLLRMHRGDAAAAATLWAAHAGVMRAYARSVLGPRAASDARDDAVQSAFGRILDADERTLAAVIDPRAWLLTSVRHAALTALRAQRREAARREHIATAPSRPLAATPDIGPQIDALPRHLREVLVLRHVAGLSFDQLAIALGVPRSTAASRYDRALRTLRDALHTLHLHEVPSHA